MIPLRIRAAWNVLRGRQTLYRCPSLVIAAPIELEEYAMIVGGRVDVSHLAD